VEGLQIRRDAALFELQKGELAFARMEGHRDCVAYFAGRARIRFAPTQPVERENLRRRYGRPEFDEVVASVVFLFADTTAEELRSRLRFGPARFAYARPTSPENLRDLIVKKSGFVVPSLARALLERRSSRYFAAVVMTGDGVRWRFEIDPARTEEVEFSRVSDGGALPSWTWVRCRTAGAASDSLERDRVPPLVVRSYTIDMTLGGGLVPSYVVDMGCEVVDDSLRYLPLQLADIHTAPDSVRTSDGVSCPVTWNQDASLWVKNEVFWVDLGRMRRHGERFRLHMRYQGQALGQEVGIPLLSSRAGWYPVVDWEDPAFYDITFHLDRPLSVVSIGDSVSTEEDPDGRVASRWRTSDPVWSATWHIGELDQAIVQREGLPEFRVISYGGRDDLVRRDLLRLSRKSPGKALIAPVGNDVAASYSFYQEILGALPLTRLNAIESYDTHGEAYAGFLLLDWTTFQGSNPWGEDDILRAHEVAHQWWGVGTRPRTYRDRWLGEGMSEFFALWFLQAKRNDTKLYLSKLSDARERIVGAPEKASAWLGFRAYDMRSGSEAYRTAIYDRGAWAMHMLRLYMMDLETLDDSRFKAMLRDLASRYGGRSVSTREFARVLERHVGEPMDWFFDEWVKDVAVPEYRYDWRTLRGEDGRPSLVLHVAQRRVPPGFRMAVPIRIELADGQVSRTRVWVDRPEVEVRFDSLPSEPKDVVFNEFLGVLCTATRSDH